MARYAMVHDATGFVANVIEWDPESPEGKTWGPPPGYTMVLDDPPSAGPGFTYDGTSFHPPPGGVVVE